MAVALFFESTIVVTKMTCLDVDVDSDDDVHKTKMLQPQSRLSADEGGAKCKRGIDLQME